MRDKSGQAIGLLMAALMVVVLLTWVLAARAEPTKPLERPITMAAFPYADVGAAITDLASTGVVGDGRLFATTKEGAIWVIDDSGNVAPTPFLDLRGVVATMGEAGLASLAFDPNYASNGRFYVTYVRDYQEAQEVVTRLHLARFAVSGDDQDVADSASEEILLSVVQPGYLHNAGDIAFGPLDGFLYLALGEGRSFFLPEHYEAAQDLGTLLGKIVRVDVSGSSGYAVPPDNPFVGQAGAMEEIWALGFRNPWRISFDAQSGDLYVADVGQATWEEVNRIRPGEEGGNFGWPCMEGLMVYDEAACQPGVRLTLPVHAYTHDSAGQPRSCSITGGFVYRGAAYADRLGGRYVFTDWCNSTLRLMELEPTYPVQRLPASAGLRVTTFGEDANGELYSGGMDGLIRRLVEVGDWERIAVPVVTR